MSADEMRSVVLRYIQAVWNRNDTVAMDELTTPDFTYYLGGQPGRDRLAMQRFLSMTRAAFPDWEVGVVAVISEGDLVAARWEGTATHLGVFHGIAPTGRKIIVSGINLYRLQSGRIAAEWEQTDSLGMLRQLGVLPA